MIQEMTDLLEKAAGPRKLRRRIRGKQKDLPSYPTSSEADAEDLPGYPADDDEDLPSHPTDDDEHPAGQPPQDEGPPATSVTPPMKKPQEWIATTPTP